MGLVEIAKKLSERAEKSWAENGKHERKKPIINLLEPDEYQGKPLIKLNDDLTIEININKADLPEIGSYYDLNNIFSQLSLELRTHYDSAAQALPKVVAKELKEYFDPKPETKKLTKKEKIKSLAEIESQSHRAKVIKSSYKNSK